MVFLGRSTLPPRTGLGQNSHHNRPARYGKRNLFLWGDPMTNKSKEEDMPSEIDFSKASRGLHHVPVDARVFLPAAIKRSVWEYFSARAQQKGVGLSQLLTDVLKHDIEINEAQK